MCIGGGGPEVSGEEGKSYAHRVKIARYFANWAKVKSGFSAESTESTEVKAAFCMGGAGVQLFTTGSTEDTRKSRFYSVCSVTSVVKRLAGLTLHSPNLACQMRFDTILGEQTEVATAFDVGIFKLHCSRDEHGQFELHVHGIGGFRQLIL